MRSPAVLVLPLALLAAACGSSASPASSTGSSSGKASVAARSVSSLGTVLVDGQGRTLYVFTPEKSGNLQCTGGCASAWPPLKASSGQTPSAAGGANASMISTVADPSGGAVVTYAGWPLHTYASDSGPGKAGGQGIAGKWWVISPSGALVTKKASSSSAGSTGVRHGGY